MTTTPEKAAPIPAEVLALRDRLLAEHERLSHALALRKGVHVLHDGDIGKLATLVLDAAILADRASREERIREARPSLPDSREEQIRADERDRLYEEFTSAFTEEVYQIRGAAMWAGEVLSRKGAMFPAERARARQGGNNG